MFNTTSQQPSASRINLKMKVPSKMVLNKKKSTPAASTSTYTTSLPLKRGRQKQLRHLVKTLGMYIYDYLYMCEFLQ